MSRAGGVASGVVAVLATAALLTAATPATPATAAPASATAGAPGRCTAGHGVGVVVEFHQLGGRDLRRCDPGGGGRTAARILQRQGLRSTYVQRMPGFLCRLDGVPAQDPCVNTPPDDAYWSLWWSDGDTARWRYAASGIDSLDLPDGASLALTWDGVAGDVPPSVPPRTAASGAVAGDRPGPLAAPARRAGDPADDGLPVWVAPGAIGLLVAAAGAAAVVRRRRAGVVARERPAAARPAPRGLVAVGDRPRRRGVHDHEPAAAAAAGRGGDAGRGGAPRRRSPGRARSGSTSWLGVLIVVLRVAVPGGLRRRRRPGAVVLLDLPAVPLPGWVAGVTLLGPLTRESLLAGLYDGLRLATIVICVGAANSLANPKRLLRSVPPALYEIGTALVVAVTVLPQFADSVRRVRAAQALRAGESGRVARLRRLLVPVLEDALERSLALAAGMDARGYGRAGGADARAGAGHRRADARRPGRHLRRHLRRPRPHRARAAWRCRCWPLGALAALAGLLSAGRRVRAHPLPPRPVALARAGGGRPGGVATATLLLVGRDAPAAGRVPRRSPWCPTVSGVSLLAVVVALAGALCSPAAGAARPARPPTRAAPPEEAGRMIELRGIRFAYDDARPSSTAST